MFEANRSIPVLIPSYEPNQHFLELLEELKEIGITNILVVNDGSGKVYDSFFEQASSLYGCTVLQHEINRGKGAALKTGFQYLLQHYPENIGCVTADSDGQHAPASIKACIQALSENPESFILGCRDFSLPGIPEASLIGNRNTNKIIRCLHGVDLKDTQTGLRGIPRTFMKQCVVLKGERFEYEIRMIDAALKAHFVVKEVPIETIYDSKDHHSTHFRPLKDTVKIYQALGLMRCLFILLFRR